MTPLRLSALFAVLLALLVSGSLRAPSAQAAPTIEDAVIFRSLSTTASGQTLRITSATDLDLIAPLLRGFQIQYPTISIEYTEYNASQKMNDALQADCGQAVSSTDLVLSSALDLQVQLVNDGCALRHEITASLPDWARWRNEVFGLTYEPVVIVYRKSAFAQTPPPSDRFAMLDLLRHDPATFLDHIGTYDIRSSGAGYLFAAQDSAQASTFGRIMESLARARARLTCCTAPILDGIEDGTLSLAYNVIGAYALDRIHKGSTNIGIVFPNDYTLVFSRAAFIYKYARAPQAAGLFIDFALSPEGRRILRDETTLLSPIDGESGLRQLYAVAEDHTLRLRPIELSPALLVGLDTHKRRHLLKEWMAALHDIATSEPPTPEMMTP